MSDNEETKTAQKKSSASAAGGYSHERLIADADSFTGYPAHVVAGALATAKKQTLSPDETKMLVEKWLQSEVN